MLLFLTDYGQISIQPVLPSVGLVQQDGLWNILVINSTAQTVDARIDLALKNRMSGDDVLAASCNQVSLTVGARQLNVNTLGIIQYNYLSPDINTGLNSFLPAGSYIACYSILTGEAKDYLAAIECVPFDVEPLSPPILIYPSDSAVLDIDPKQFSWLPPTPPELFSNLNYEIMISEILEGQTPGEAMHNNMPLVYETGLPINIYSRSQVFNTMEAGNWYAWQVVAKNGSQYAGKSEIRVFSYDPAKPPGDYVKATPYVVLRKGSPEQAVAPDGYLKMVYFNRLSDTTAFIEISETGVKELANKKTGFNIPLRRGENLIQYYLPRIIKPDVKKVYRAMLVNSAGERWELIFSVRYNND